MRILLLILLTLMYCAASVNAQTLPPPGGGCAIKFSYDNAGNRIKRYYDCTDPIGPGGTDTLRGDNGPVVGLRKAAGAGNGDDDFKVSIFPNPTMGRFTVTTSPHKGNCILHLFDATGRLMQSREMTTNQETFNIEQLPDGIYQLNLSTGNKNKVFKIVKQ